MDQSQTTPSSPPHIYVDMQKRGIRAWFLIAFMSLTVLSIPLGVYLVSQKTNVLPQAAAPQQLPQTVSLTLETPKTSLSDGAEFPVYIKIKSDTTPINLINANISFSPKNFEVVRIATESASAPLSNGKYIDPQWVDLNFDNTLGRASVIGGIPNPALQTDQDTNYYLATLFFRAKGSAQTDISLTDQSGIYSASDNQNILKDKNGLNLSLNYSASSTPVPNPILKPNLFPSSPSATLTSPVGGAVYSYYKTVPIEWSTTGLKSIKELNLYINGKLFGLLGSNLDNTGRVLWQPNKTLNVPLINPQNTFEIELVAQTKSGQILKEKTLGPFGLIPQADFVNISTPSANITLSG